MQLNIVPLKFSNNALLKKIIEYLSDLFDNVNVFYTLIDIEKAYLTSRRQYHSTQILESLIKSKPETEGYIMVLTEMDICVPVLTHIYGEAQLNGKYSIVSVCRLYEEFYVSESNPKLLTERTLKEILHELGHNFGLKHCDNWDCVMHTANNIEEIDIKGKFYCESCFKFIKSKNLLII